MKTNLHTIQLIAAIIGGDRGVADNVLAEFVQRLKHDAPRASRDTWSFLIARNRKAT